jgi:dipeptidyl aminopeptidase/acylaminoacyl peptidase
MDDPGALGDFSLDKEQTKAAFFFSDLKNPGEVRVKELRSARTRTLTGFNRRILSRVRLGEVEEIWFKGPDGNDLQGWIVFPPDFDPVKTYPSILEIHGGPMVQYGRVFVHEIQFLAANGYLVYLCNPRGSSGYGRAHTKAIWNDWGNKDFQDLMAMADLVQARPYVDPKRMGVTGGSYGGFMTNWIIGQTDRFRAAVTQRCLTNLISFYGTSDFNWTFQFEFGDRPPWEDLENYWRQSPLKHVAKAKTPTLIIHSEQDMRCPIEQGEQLFVALKKLGVETEMVIFPEESHGLSRAGRTDRRIDRLNHILRWFDRHLKA